MKNHKDDSASRSGKDLPPAPAKITHTPAPWRFSWAGSNMRDNYSRPLAIAALNTPALIGGIFVDVPGGIDVAEANARHIIRCVNAHDELIAALGNLADCVERRLNELRQGGLIFDMTEFPDLCLLARTAIARATRTNK